MSGFSHTSAGLRVALCLAVLLLPAAVAAGGVEAAQATRGLSPDVHIEAATLLTTYGDPAGFVTSTGEKYDGVVKLVVSGAGGSYLGSGSLISDRYILTAAHMLDLSGDGNADVAPEDIEVTFHLPEGTAVTGAVSRDIHPEYDPAAWFSNDVGIIELSVAAPGKATRYEIYRGSDELGAVIELAGYGRSGTGDQGDVLAAGTKRAGFNEIDDINTFDGRSGKDIPDGTQLNYDFDNGLSENDAFDFFFDIPGLGLGEDEAFIAPGDSGGPSFIDGQVAGIHSYGVRLTYQSGPPWTRTSDVDGTLNSSFGEFATDMRVSAYQDWIDYFINALLGDANRDGSVDMADFQILVDNWDPLGSGNGWADGDFDADGAVGNTDFAHVLANWTGGAGGAAVPEPATALLFSSAAVVLLGRRPRSCKKPPA